MPKVPSEAVSDENALLMQSQDKEESQAQTYKLLTEISSKVQTELDLIDAILQAPNKIARKQAIEDACKQLNRHPRSIMRKLKRVQQEGIASLATGRKDKDQFRISEQWFNFIVDIYKWGQREGSKINHHQVYVHLMALANQRERLREQKYAKRFKGYTEVLENLVQGQHPSHVTVYKSINRYLSQRNTNARHPGAFPGRLVVQTTDGLIEISHSNQIWQIDHTKLDILLFDEKGQEIGRPYITLVMDSYSGCIAGYYLGFEAAGSHEVGLALRHAILPKRYGTEYELQANWNICGIPDYVMTDRAKEFKSEHLKQISLQLGFQRRLRAFPSAGGLVESIFDKINKELLSMLPGYTGSSVEDRPDNVETHANLTLDDLERKLVRYFVDHYNQHFYPDSKLTASERLEKPKRFDRWQKMLLAEPEILNERELDICLMKVVPRKVEKYGCVRFEKLLYQGEALAGRDYEGKLVSLRYDQRNIATLLVYSYSKEGKAEEFIGTVQAIGLEKEQFSLEEWRYLKKKMRDKDKEVDNSILLTERVDLFDFVEEERKSKRQRRKTANARQTRKANQSKIVELYPEPRVDESTIAPQEIVTVTSDSLVKKPVESIYEPKPEIARPKKTRRSRAGVQDWNQFTQDNW